MGFEPEICHVMFHHTNNFYQLKLVQAKGLEPILGSLRDYYSASRIPLALKLFGSITDPAFAKWVLYYSRHNTHRPISVFVFVENAWIEFRFNSTPSLKSVPHNKKTAFQRLSRFLCCTVYLKSQSLLGEYNWRQPYYRASHRPGH